MHIPKKSFSGYWSLLGEAWRTMWRKPAAFIPTAYSILGFLAIALLVERVGKATLPGRVSGAEALPLVVLLAVGLVLGVALIIHVGAMQMGVMGRIATGRNTTFKEAFKEATSRFGRMAGLLGAAIVAALPLILVGGLLFASLVWFTSHDPTAFVVFGTGFLGLLIFAGMIFYGAWFVFILPLGRFQKGSAWSAIREAWRLLWYDAAHVWPTYLINLLVSFGIAIIMSIVSAILMGLVGGAEVPFAWQITQSVVNLIVSVWLLLFVFLSFVRRYRPKVS